MIDREYTFGATTVYCDADNCKQSMQIDARIDNHPVDNSDAVQEIKKYGWVVKRINGEWHHFCCSDCAGKEA